MTEHTIDEMVKEFAADLKNDTGVMIRHEGKLILITKQNDVVSWHPLEDAECGPQP